MGVLKFIFLLKQTGTQFLLMKKIYTFLFIFLIFRYLISQSITHFFFCKTYLINFFKRKPTSYLFNYFGWDSARDFLSNKNIQTLPNIMNQGKTSCFFYKIFVNICNLISTKHSNNSNKFMNVSIQADTFCIFINETNSNRTQRKYIFSTILFCFKFENIYSHKNLDHFGCNKNTNKVFILTYSCL